MRRSIWAVRDHLCWPGRLVKADTSGTSAVEFALILPVLAGLLFAAVDLAGLWNMRLGLEQAAQRGIERAANTLGVTDNTEQVRAEAIAAYGQPLATATVDLWLECDGVRQASISAGCNNAQRAVYIALRLEDNFVPSFGWGGLFTGEPSGGLTVAGDAAVRLQ